MSGAGAGDTGRGSAMTLGGEWWLFVSLPPAVRHRAGARSEPAEMTSPRGSALLVPPERVLAAVDGLSGIRCICGRGGLASLVVSGGVGTGVGRGAEPGMGFRG
ncbi:hypothetical protein GCM10012285_32820 [Streptomyces kronopolitis]|uniref:Uncharacterized protein n=1 Tax=Streptomyces kronopolitis TaxID=1612435 RepID=A0ABQ2JI32_9ACTN|nr:hypothetical protein GCM10012285_32820 [Streptomyces kronopolitis]